MDVGPKSDNRSRGKQNERQRTSGSRSSTVLIVVVQCVCGDIMYICTRYCVFVFFFYRETRRLRSPGFLFSRSAMHLWKVKIICWRDCTWPNCWVSTAVCYDVCPVFPPKVTTVPLLLCDVELYCCSVCA